VGLSSVRKVCNPGEHPLVSIVPHCRLQRKVEVGRCCGIRAWYNRCRFRSGSLWRVMVPSRQGNWSTNPKVFPTRFGLDAMPPAVVISDPPLDRICPHCGTSQPISRFKRRSRREGQRESWCRNCINTAERDRRLRKRFGIVRTMGQHIRLGCPAAQVEAVVAVAVERLGGCEAVGIAIADLVLQSRSHRDALTAYRLVWKMIEHGDR